MKADPGQLLWMPPDRILREFFQEPPFYFDFIIIVFLVYFHTGK
jgi:hypothetical protein